LKLVGGEWLNEDRHVVKVLILLLPLFVHYAGCKLFWWSTVLKPTGKRPETRIWSSDEPPLGVIFDMILDPSGRSPSMVHHHQNELAF